MKFVIVLLFYLCNHLETSGESYSFHKFSGPVSGQIQEVYVQAGSQGHPRGQTVDFIAKPDYTYSYGVEDPLTANSQTHKEQRDGDAVHGEYRVMQPDGMIRIVRYTSDPEKGFQAQVLYALPAIRGQEQEPPQQPPPQQHHPQQRQQERLPQHRNPEPYHHHQQQLQDEQEEDED